MKVSFYEGILPMPEGDPYVVHQHLWRTFDLPQGATRPYLFYPGADDPRLKRLMRVRATVQPTTAQLNRIEIDICDGENTLFWIRCNPTWAQPQGYNTKSKRRSLMEPGDVEAWFRRQGDRHGFELLPLVGVMNEGPVRWRKGRRRCVVGSVHICGSLKITDQTAFARAMVEGIGRSRAFGFGLLMAMERDNERLIESERKAGWGRILAGGAYGAGLPAGCSSGDQGRDTSGTYGR